MQFLPQDKVASFAALKPDELLKETERAIGDSSLFEQHLKLCEMQSDSTNLNSQVSTYRQDLERKERERNLLSREIEKVKKMNALELYE